MMPLENSMTATQQIPVAVSNGIIISTVFGMRFLSGVMVSK